MLNIPADDSRAVAVISAIRSGDLEGLGHLLDDNPGLATARIVDAQGVSRTLLHIATDWPGHFPNSSMTVAALVAAGADVNAWVTHPSRPECQETPLHWAASNDDVAALDALLDCGADALGLLDRVEEYCERQPPPSPNEITNAFWNACRGGHRQTAEYLLGRGAELNWIGYDRRTPLQAANESGAKDLITWLHSQGAKLAEELE